MTTAHLEMTTSTTTHTRKSQRVYRSPSSLNDSIPYSKQPAEAKKKEDDTLLLNMNAEDKEASTILMALARHASRILEEKKTSTNSGSMSIRNLLDNAQAPSTADVHQVNKSRGFQAPSFDNRNVRASFRHPNSVRPHYTTTTNRLTKFKKSATHVHISYRIHAHQNSILSRSSLNKYANSSFPSAFRPAYHSNSSTTTTNTTTTSITPYRRWSQNSPSLSPPSSSSN